MCWGIGQETLTTKKFNEENIIRVLQEEEGAITVRDVCRKPQITEQIFYGFQNPAIGGVRCENQSGPTFLSLSHSLDRAGLSFVSAQSGLPVPLSCDTLPTLNCHIRCGDF